jgi:hypothetical protein
LLIILFCLKLQIHYALHVHVIFESFEFGLILELPKVYWWRGESPLVMKHVYRPGAFWDWSCWSLQSGSCRLERDCDGIFKSPVVIFFSKSPTMPFIGLASLINYNVFRRGYSLVFFYASVEVLFNGYDAAKLYPFISCLWNFCLLD